MSFQGAAPDVLSKLTPAQRQMLQTYLSGQGQPAGAAFAAAVQAQQQQKAAAAAAAAVVAQKKNAPTAPPSGKATPAAQPSTSSAQAAVAAAASDNAKKQLAGHKKRKLYERETGVEGVSICIPESRAFTSLLEKEHEVDVLVHQRLCELKEAIKQPERVKKKMRLYVFHTHMHQPSTSSRGSVGSAAGELLRPPAPAPHPGDVPCWALHVVGRVMELDAPAPAASVSGAPAVSGSLQQQSSNVGSTVVNAGGAAAAKPADRTLLQSAGSSGPQPVPTGPKEKIGATYFFRRVEVQLDERQYPGDAGRVVWDKTQAAEHKGGMDPRSEVWKDHLEVRRAGSEACDATVTITLDFQPERFVLDQRLSEVLELQYETKPRILKAFWQYVQQHGLQNPQQPQQLHLPMELANVTGMSFVQLSDAGDALDHLLSPLPPLVVKHTVRCDGPSPSITACYDLDVEMPAAQPGERVVHLLDKLNRDAELESIDAKLSDTVRWLNERKRRHDFYAGFAHAPVDFINSLVASMGRELRVPPQAASYDLWLDRPTDIFAGQPWVQEAVLKHLQARREAKVHACLYVPVYDVLVGCEHCLTLRMRRKNLEASEA